MIATVKKFLLIFLLFVVPLQYSWAAAAAYCTHEDRQGGHFGHHVHQHQETAVDASTSAATGEAKSKDMSGKAGKQHHDCSVCQFSTQAALPALMPALLTGLPVSHTASEAGVYTSHIPDHPAVPDWALAA